MTAVREFVEADEWRGNRLLDCLPIAEREVVLGRAESVTLRTGQVLAEAGQPLDHGYFPRGGMLSLVAVIEDGTMVEASTIGNEGMFGLQIVAGVDSSSNLRTMCQIDGEALRVSTNDLRELGRPGTKLHTLLMRYGHALFVQAAQAVLCNRRHSAEQRCAKWLLLSHDRVGRDSFRLTQEFLAQMLGVRRASVTTVANELRRRSLIEYHRGAITILDRAGLEAASCVCYAVIREEYDNYLRMAASAASA
ncbi:MAG TPA: Crp/Fnr family transcriptional regulator [Actinomycetota bacterium]